MKAPTAFPVSAIVRVVEDSPKEPQSGEHIAQLGRDIRISTTLLDEYCFSSPTDLTHDLMSLLGAVRFADRSVKRHHCDGWGRRLDIELPVLDKSLWRSEAVTSALKECLGYLTGDAWHFKFVQRKSRPRDDRQGHTVSSSDVARVFIPYSHGLDSYAQMRLLQQREPGCEVVCVFTDNKSNSKTWKQFCKDKPQGGVRAVKVPVEVSEPHHAEPTFRSRPFMYYILSAYGALRTGSSRVLIPENGQGSLGGSFVPLGNESKHRSCHPGFTTRVRDLLKALTRQTVTFEHPALFQTKGQVMGALAAIEPDVDNWLHNHRSCSHDQRHANHDGVRVHCGACGNCILRRASAIVAGVADSTTYKFSSLTAEALEQAVLGAGEAPREIKSFNDLAANSIRSMQRMADLSKAPASPIVWAEAVGLAEYLALDVQKVRADLTELIQQHEREWNRFLAECGASSWIAQMARG
jgi:hypothetical protein